MLLLWTRVGYATLTHPGITEQTLGQPSAEENGDVWSIRNASVGQTEGPEASWSVPQRC